ncbi:MAG: leucine-rich repeat domain-containing protein, partial [Muribaculaceae bacterium]|nr:leucine-rich repeat domain-containing protein [Muribaculaceae bacterium]
MAYLDSVRLRVVCVIMLLTTLSSVAQRVYVAGLYYNIDPVTKTAKVLPFQEGIEGEMQVERAYSAAHIIVPSSINVDGENYVVTTIENVAFSHSSVETIQLPPTIKIIKPSAFRSVESLQEIIIPTGVELNAGAFGNAVLLSRVVLPEDITDIPQNVFEGTALTEIALPSTVTSIGNSAFSGVSFSNGIFLNEGLESIYENAFKGKNSDSAVTSMQLVIPSTVNKIGNNAFDESAISTLWFEGSPQNVDAVKSFAGMPVENIVWATEKSPYSGLTIGVRDESLTTLYYDIEKFSAIKPSVKISSDKNVTVGSKSPKGQPAEILNALPPVSFREGKIDLNNFIGLCHLTDLKYESWNPEIATIDGNSIVTFHKSGVVTIVTSSASESADRPLIGKERQLYIMPMTVAVNVDADGEITYSSGDLTNEEVKSRLSREATLSNVRVKDDNNDEWIIKCTSGAEGDGMVFVYGSMAPMSTGPEVELPSIVESISYGGEPIDMSVIDGDIASEFGAIKYRSSDESVLKVEGALLYPVGVGNAEITAICDGVEFTDGGVRRIEVASRKVTAKAKSTTIEDDATSIPAVEYEVTGLVGDDKPESIIESWEWNNARIEEGVYGVGEPVLKDNPLYDVMVDCEGSSLYVVRAVTRVVAEMDFADDAPQNSKMMLTLSGACRVKCGQATANGQIGSVALPLDGSVKTVLCDYPERIIGVVLKNAGLARVKIGSGVTELESLDVSGNNLTIGSLVLSGDIADNIDIIVGTQEQIPVSVTNDNEIALGDVGNGISVRWYDNDGTELTAGTDYNHESGIYTFLKSLNGVYAELSDGLITVSTVP